MGGDVSVMSVEGEGVMFLLVFLLVCVVDVVKLSIVVDDVVVMLIVDCNLIICSMFKMLLSLYSDVVFYVVLVEEVVVWLGEWLIVYVLIDDVMVWGGGVLLEVIGVIVVVVGDVMMMILLWLVSVDVECDELFVIGLICVVVKLVSGVVLIVVILDKLVVKNNLIFDFVL